MLARFHVVTVFGGVNEMQSCELTVVGVWRKQFRIVFIQERMMGIR